MAPFVTAFLFALLKVIDSVNQLVQVLDATDVLWRIIAHEHAFNFGAPHGLLGHVRSITTVQVQFNQFLNQVGEISKF